MTATKQATETIFIYRARSLDFESIDPAGDLWVAFDGSGVWRSHGKVSGTTATSGMELADYLFHSEEIAFVNSIQDDVTIVELICG